MERGGRGDKHSSSEHEARGLLERTPSPDGRTLHSNGRHSQQGQLGQQHGGGTTLRHGEHEHISSEGVHGRTAVAAAAAAGPGASSIGDLLEHKEGNGAAAEGRLGGSSAWRRTAAAGHRNSSDSLVFGLEPPDSGGAAGVAGPLARQAGSAGGAGGLRSVSFLTAMLMGVALCFHSLLEGAAMGAQPTIRWASRRAGGRGRGQVL